MLVENCTLTYKGKIHSFNQFILNYFQHHSLPEISHVHLREIQCCFAAQILGSYTDKNAAVGAILLKWRIFKTMELPLGDLKLFAYFVKTFLYQEVSYQT